VMSQDFGDGSVSGLWRHLMSQDIGNTTAVWVGFGIGIER